MKRLLYLIVFIFVIVMPSQVFSDAQLIMGYTPYKLSEGIVMMFVGMSLYLFGCDREFKLKSKQKIK